MKALEALRDSQVNIAFRTKDDGTLQFVDQEEQLWTETIKGTVRKHNGFRREYDDWFPLLNDSTAWHVWINKKGTQREIVIENPWKDAVEKSPVKRAARAKVGGRSEVMIRLEDGTLWDQRGDWWHKIADAKDYDGWYPMSEHHPYAYLAFPDKATSVNYYDCSKAKPAPEPEPRTETVAAEAPIKKRRLKKEWDLEEVSPEVLVATAGVAEALAKSIESFNSVGEVPAAKDCAVELLRISKSISWLLREDRDRYR